MSRSHGILLLATTAAGACASSRTIRIESSVPAAVSDWGGRAACEKTPCSWTFSRETCFLFDSSSGHIILLAEAPDGRSMMTPAMPTCDVAEDTVVRFEMPSTVDSSDCAVIIDDGQAQRFDDCEQLRAP